MFRTKERFDKLQPQAQERECISGCIKFDGEDLGKQNIVIELISQRI